MATYVYETIPPGADELPERFEWVQSMKDVPLSHHPDSGLPVRRIIMGGYGAIGLRQKSPVASSPGASPVASCAAGCACHRGSRIPAL